MMTCGAWILMHVIYHVLKMPPNSQAAILFQDVGFDDLHVIFETF